MKTRTEKLVDMIYYLAIAFGAGLICGYIWGWKALMGG